MAEARILRGEPVAAALTARLKAEAEALTAQGKKPVLAIMSVGDRPDQSSYKKGALKRSAAVGIGTVEVTAPEDAGEEELRRLLQMLGEDRTVSGVLPLRPFRTVSAEKEKELLNLLPAEKDMDGAGDRAMLSLYAGGSEGYAPCTAEAVIELLKHYEIPLAGRHVVIVGRSLVIGKPLAMLMLQENASVTVCHSRSENLAELCRSGDIVVSAVGRAKMLGAEHFRAGQIVVDVGINVDQETGKLCGDVDFDTVSQIVAAITPVPGGVGSVTTSVLAKHIIQSAKRA